VRGAVEGWKLTQVQAAARLGVTQPRLNDLLRGRVDPAEIVRKAAARRWSK
jgi:predicted XRE-type DNA-binding protein